MLERTVTVVNTLGLHARAAAKFVHLAGRFACQVRVSRNGREMDGKSIMGLLLLAAPRGATVTIAADGSDEADALDALVALVPKRGFHNPFRVEYEVVNLDTLEQRFEAGAVVTREMLVAARLVTGNAPIKVLGRGEVSKALTVHANKFSGKAAEKIAAAGGKVEALG